MHFRISAAEVEAVEVLRQRGVAQRREGGQFGPAALERFQVVGIIEVEGLIAGDAQANAPCHGCVSRAACTAGQASSGTTTGQLHQPFHVEVPRAAVGQAVQGLVVQAALIGGDKSQVAAFERRQGPARHGAQERRQPGGGERLGQPGMVARRAGLVGDHAGQPHLRLELGESLDRGRQAAGGAVGRDRQHDRGRQQQGDLGRAPFQCRGRRAVEQAHDAFDHGQIGLRSGLGEELPHVVGRGHPGVKVVAGSAGGPRQVGGIEEIGADLEGLHPQPLLPQGANDSQRQRGLADATAGGGDDDSGASGLAHAAALHKCHRWIDSSRRAMPAARKSAAAVAIRALAAGM